MIFKNAAHSLGLGEAQSNSASHQAPNYVHVQHSWISQNNLLELDLNCIITRNNVSLKMWCAVCWLLPLWKWIISWWVWVKLLTLIMLWVKDKIHRTVFHNNFQYSFSIKQKIEVSALKATLLICWWNQRSINAKIFLKTLLI